MQGAVSDSDEKGESSDAEDTAFLPATIFPDEPKVGKVCTFRVVSVDDGQVEVAYAHNSTPDESRGKDSGNGKTWEKHLADY